MWTLKVDPRDLSVPRFRWRDWLREVRVSGSAGLFISLLVHSLLALVLTWIIVSHPDHSDPNPLIVSWLDPAATVPATKRRPVQIPLELSSPRRVSSSPPSSPAQQPVEPARGATVVRPAAVAGALDNRRLAALGSVEDWERHGGSAKAQAAIKAGLAWFARQQTSDGRWELHQGYPHAGASVIRTDTGATGLALLAFLGAGHSPATGEHATTVRKGLQWLIDTQDRQTGDLHDLRQEEGRNPSFYAHSLATIALCEALAMTGDAEWLRPPARRAVEYLLRAQHPELGGWKYRPISQTMMGDLSVTGWALMALHSARMADLPVPDHEFERASRFLDSVQVQQGARYKYEPLDPPQRVTPALTAEGILCRQWLGWPKDHPAMIDAVGWLTSDENRPEWTAGRRNLYAWYYTAQVLHNLGGPAWESWYPPVRDLLIKHQMAGGSTRAPHDVRGSWHPTQPPGTESEYGDKAGRLYVTALCLLILETPLRHKPLYEYETGPSP
jgi:hypothetical protein